MSFRRVAECSCSIFEKGQIYVVQKTASGRQRMAIMQKFAEEVVQHELGAGALKPGKAGRFTPATCWSDLIAEAFRYELLQEATNIAKARVSQRVQAVGDQFTAWAYMCKEVLGEEPEMEVPKGPLDLEIPGDVSVDELARRREAIDEMNKRLTGS